MMKRRTVVLSDRFQVTEDRELMARVRLAKRRLFAEQAKEEGSFWVEEESK